MKRPRSVTLSLVVSSWTLVVATGYVPSPAAAFAPGRSVGFVQQPRRWEAVRLQVSREDAGVDGRTAEESLARGPQGEPRDVFFEADGPKAASDLQAPASPKTGLDDLIRAGAHKVTGVHKSMIDTLHHTVRRRRDALEDDELTSESEADRGKIDSGPLRLIAERVTRANAPDAPQAPVSKSPEWHRLAQHAKHIQRIHLRSLVNDPTRCAALTAETDGVLLDYSRQQVTQGTMDLLLALARRQNLAEKITAMQRGDKINLTEKRAVLHAATRAGPKESIIVDGVDVVKLVHEQLARIQQFTERIRSGELRGHTGRPIKNIVSVGIGGSYLGPSFINEVLATEREGIFTSQGFTLRFLSNVDPVDVERSISGLDAEETIVVIVSKTFTTAETMLNARTMRQWLWDRMSGGSEDKHVTATHVVACASESAAAEVAAFGVTDSRFFRFWDWVGGRYSLCSSAGLVPLALKYGFPLLDKMLAGARSMDRHFFNTPLKQNVPVIMGLLGVWNLSFLGYKARTMLPYSEALWKFPAHVQQVDMESNGKGVTVDGEEIDYDIGEINFGESGTNSQHSFFQLLHMGQPVPCDFIGFVESQNNLVHTEGETLSSHDELMANFFAQPDALALGRTADELRALEPDIPDELLPHRTFSGNRPSLSLLLPQLTAYTAGQMLALYEHRTAVQGFVWGINSFDQWGVEYGKTLAKTIRNQLVLARKQCVPVTGVNPSTDRLMNRYLQGDGGYDSQWMNAPEALSFCQDKIGMAEDATAEEVAGAAEQIIANIDSFKH